MKKLFLIPLLACLCCVMAWGTVHTAGTYQELKDALAAAANGDEIQLTADIDYGTVTYGDNFNITKSITLNGQNHTLKGAGQRQSGNSNYATIWVNLSGSSVIDVTFKDITIINERTTGAYNNKAIETRGNIGTLTFDNVALTAKSAALQIGGSQSTKANVEMTDCHLTATVYYCLISYNPYILHAENCTYDGWCSFYLKGVDGSAGSRGSELYVNNCYLNNPNPYTGLSNAFGAIVLEDDGIEIHVTNSTVIATSTDPVNAPQSGVNLSSLASRTVEEVVVNIDATTQAQTTMTDDVPVLEASSAWVAAAETGKISIQHNVPAAKTNLTEGLRDGLYNGKMGTICVAKNVTNVSGATFYTVSYVEMQGNEPWHLYFDEKADNTTLEAGVPYVFIANSDKITGTFANEDPVSAGWAGTSMMYGNLYATAVTFNNAADLDPYYVINNNRFYLMGDNVKIPVGRAFVDLSEVPTEDPTPATDPAFARRRICLTNGAPQSPTALENAAAEIKVEKVVRNGQVLILRDGQFYDVTGRVVE